MQYIYRPTAIKKFIIVVITVRMLTKILHKLTNLSATKHRLISPHLKITRDDHRNVYPKLNRIMHE